MKRKSLAFGLAAVCLLAGSGEAHGAGERAPGNAGTDKVILITDYTFTGADAPFFAGIKEGFFRHQHIDLTVEPGVSSGDTATKVATGLGTFGLTDTFAMTTAIAHDAKIRAIATWFQKHVGGMCGIKEHHPLTSYKSFEHSTAVGSDTGYYQFLPQLMRDHGADPSTIKFVPMTNSAAHTALLTNQGDETTCGVTSNSSFADAAKQLNLHLSFFPFAKHGFNMLGHSLITSDAVIAKQPRLAQEFVDAFAQSIVWSALHPHQAIADYIAANPQQDASVEIKNLTNIVPYYWDKKAAGSTGMFVIPVAKMKQTVAFANKAYQLHVKYQDVYSNRFAHKIPKSLRFAKLSSK